MKSKNILQKIALIILTIFAIQSCNVSTSGTWANENIDPDERQQIKVLNDKLFKAIINKDTAGIKALMSRKLIEATGKNLEQIIDQAHNAIHSDSYSILDEYNVHNSSAGINTTLHSGDNNYRISFQALNKETYVALLLPNGLENKMLITAIYGNYDNEWKLNILQFGQYSLFNKTATDYYKLAEESYHKSYLIDAVNYAGLSKDCLRPANKYLQYKKEKEIRDFYERLMKEVNEKYKLPMVLNNIDTRPKVFRISAEMINEGFFPMVSYVSDIKLKDTLALKVENDKVKKEIGRLFMGIDKHKKYVFYRAFNEIPDGKNAVEQYGFVDQLSQ